MKTCPYCGKEYPDDVARCPVDNEVLSGGNAALPPPDDAAPAPAPPVLPDPKRAPLTDRQTRILELVLVCVIAIGPSILQSFDSLATEHSYSASPTAMGWFIHAVRQGGSLGLLWYFLTRRGKTFASLGLSWSMKGVMWSVLLFLVGRLAFDAMYTALFHSGLTHISQRAGAAHVNQLLFGGGVSLTAILFAFLNPFYEELIVRAYVMTEVKELTQSTAKAILASTLLQMSYHFYQGAPAAFAHGAEFLIFSLYYAKTNRIAPVILAHLYADVIPTLRNLWR